ncbi:MAG: MarR family transcriptional regulator [Deltaproteobacteria bacterium]|nr:MarR family transcriptional regulator [Deltaproteobacteria bacterium]
MKAEECIFFQLAKANQAGSRFWVKKVSALNLTAVQGMVIRFLYDDDRLTSSELGKKTGLDSATLTGILDRLEAGGFVERRQNPDDRRSIRIHLTEKGRSTGVKVAQLMEEGNAEFLREFNESEEVALRSLLNKIRQ